MDYAAEGRLRKMSAEKAWNTIKELAQYEEEGWNDPIFPKEGSLNYKNANIEQLLGVMECQVDTLMKDAISLMGKSEDLCGLTSNTMRQLPLEPSHQEEFKGLVTNFILDQEEKVRQLEEYMRQKRTDSPIKPHSPDSFRMKVVDKSTINTLPSPHVASFHPKDTYCYYHPCIDDRKKHYGFKPGLLGQSGSLGVDFSNMEMIENDWELESKEVSFLGRGLNSLVKLKEVEKDRIKETHHLEHIIQQPTFQHVNPSHNDGVYRYYHPYLNSNVREPSLFSVK
ncbi:hypothetical protein Tco_0067149 [Tanacetum coccineum]